MTDSVCQRLTFFLMWHWALQNGRRYRSLCSDDVVRCTARSPAINKKAPCIIRIVSVHFMSWAFCNTCNDPRTASFYSLPTLHFTFISGCEAYFRQLDLVLVFMTLQRSSRSLKSSPRSSVGRLPAVLSINLIRLPPVEITLCRQPRIVRCLRPLS
jgi:hypothetical protein